MSEEMTEPQEADEIPTVATKPGYLTPEEIATLAGVPEEDVYVPEWDRTVRLRGLTKQEQMDMRKGSTVGQDVDVDKLQVEMLIASMVEPKLGPEHVGIVTQWPSGIFDRLIMRATVLSGADEEAAKAARKSTSQNPG